MSSDLSAPKIISLDIDWTQFIPEDRTVHTDRGSFMLRDQLNDLRNSNKGFVVHNTGIPLHRVVERMNGKTADYPKAVIAEADAVISDVGTEITLPPYRIENGQVKGQSLTEWQDRLKTVCPPELMDEVRQFVESIPFAIVKTEAAPSPFKVTGIIENPELHSEFIKHLSERITERFDGLLQVTFWSRNGFDVTPTISGKGPALTFLRKLWNVESENVYVGGDSMNDLSMFSEDHEYKGIIPGNAMPELIQSLTDINRRNLYLAPQDKVGPYGVLQGLEYFDVVPKSNHDPVYIAEIASSNRIVHKLQPS